MAGVSPWFVLLIAASACRAELPRMARLGAAFTADQGQVLVSAVAQDSTGARAGLRRGDVILQAGGVAAKPEVAFVRPLLRRVDGDQVLFRILREGKEASLTVSYTAPPKEAAKGIRVEYASVKVRDHERRTLITMPEKAKKRLPAILFLAGSGCSSQESPAVTDPAVSILHGLTDLGFLTMRVEKTGVGDSGGPPCYSAEGDMTQEVDGYRAGIHALRQHPLVNSNRIYLLGHSAGATLAPLVARDLKVAKIALAGAMGSNFLDYVLGMRDRERTLAGRSEQEIAKLRQVTRACLTRLLDDGKSPDAIEAEHPECKGQVRFDSPESFTRQWHKFDLSEAWSHVKAPTLRRPWICLSSMNSSEAWSHVKAPTLVLYGTGDFVTSEFESQALVVRINANSNPKKPQAEYETQPMDHGFLNHETMRDSWNGEQGKGPRGEVIHSLIYDLFRFFDGTP